MVALFYLGIILMLVGGIWLVVAAFKESVVWGLLVLFVPFAALVFLIRHWQPAKGGFALQVIGTLLYIWTAHSVIGARLEQYRQLVAAQQQRRAPTGDSGASTKGDEPDVYAYAPSGGAAGGTSMPSTIHPRSRPAPAAARATAPVHPATPRTGVIRVADARNHIGELMRIVSKRNVVRVAKLRKVGAHTLVFEHDEHGGNITYRMDRNEISRLELLGVGGAN